MSPFYDAASAQRFGFPRVSGDEPGIATLYDAPYQFSPRERG